VNAAPVTLRLRSKRFCFVGGEAQLVPMVDGYPTQTGAVVENTITGFSIEPGTSLFTLILRNVSILAAGRLELATAPCLHLATVLIPTVAVASGIVDLPVEALTIASVRVVHSPLRVEGDRTLSVAQPGMTLELELDADNRAAILLAEGEYLIVAGRNGVPARVVVDDACPAWLDLTVTTGPA
jgi:hypothetical protein